MLTVKCKFYRHLKMVLGKFNISKPVSKVYRGLLEKKLVKINITYLENLWNPVKHLNKPTRFHLNSYKFLTKFRDCSKKIKTFFVISRVFTQNYLCKWRDTLSSRQEKCRFPPIDIQTSQKSWWYFREKRSR